VIVSDKIYIPLERLGSKANDLAKIFTYQNPEYFEKSKMGFSTAKCSPFLAHYTFQTLADNQKYIVVPRGSIKKVKAFFDKHKLPFRYIDNRNSGKDIDVQLVNTQLESQQLDIVNILKNNEGGLVEMLPGGGKTIAALGLISEIKKSTLILVHEHRLRTQWEEEIKKRLSGSFTFGRWDGDKKEEGDITIGIINTVYLMYKENKDIFSRFGVVIVDETHHLPAAMFTLVVNNISAKYRIGLTGTVKRKDQKEILLFDVLGPILTSIGAEDLKHRVTSFQYEIIETNCKVDAPTRRMWADGARVLKLDYVKLLTTLVQNSERNVVIVEKIVESIKEGYKPLILSDRVEHCKFLHRYLMDLGYKAELLIGATRKQSNWEEIRKDDSIQAIVAQRSIAEEGLDYPSLSALHLTCPSTNLPKLKQRIGRIRRVAEGKNLLPKVYDYCDNLAQFKDQYGKLQFPLKRSSKSRESFYKKLKAEYENA